MDVGRQTMRNSPTTRDQDAQPTQFSTWPITEPATKLHECAIERELIARVRRGDHTAEQTLYRMYVGPALRRARKLSAQPADAEDYVAEAFLRVLRLLHEGRGPSTSFGPYLFAVLRNLATDAYRGQRARELPSDQIGTSIDFCASRSATEDEVEARVSVRAAMGGLPQRWRDVLWRMHVEGHSPSALAEEFGVSANSVSAMAHRARNALRSAYQLSA
ncbi:MAG TPA: sigma-70 family RNA polymerase sigma factor [Jatrophihabitantaceae bacterium]|jgi:RNA polymerase sigma factor (sigma-70 family)